VVIYLIIRAERVATKLPIGGRGGVIYLFVKDVKLDLVRSTGEPVAICPIVRELIGEVCYVPVEK